ncbi:hypothetical protein PUN28_002918 [Cardiocondyla obscurior]|uniref:Uncharacterized protein n=1 Tax=Cardiocondyla obscurior TaxID=286306 RepID=A0AAW2GWL8_9HYME
MLIIKRKEKKKKEEKKALFGGLTSARPCPSLTYLTFYSVNVFATLTSITRGPSELRGEVFATPDRDILSSSRRQIKTESLARRRSGCSFPTRLSLRTYMYILPCAVREKIIRSERANARFAK